MPSVTRWAVGMAGLVLAMLVLTSASPAAAPEGPRLGFVKLSLKPPRFELLTVDPTGALPLMIAGGGRSKRPLPYPAPPSWSPDGSLIAFSGLVGGENEDGRPRLQIYVAAADGSGLQKLPGTGQAVGPVFSPDGNSIAFARSRERRKRNGSGGEDTVYESVSVWIASLDGGLPRQVTPWRNHLLQTPSSFSPDGSVLAITRAIGDMQPEAIGLNSDGTGPDVLARNALEPVFSPDGSRIAFLRGPRRTFSDRNRATTGTFTDLYTMNADGRGLERLTKTPRAVEIAPSWDPSGQRLAYTEVKPLSSNAAFLGLGDSLIEVNADGSCRTKVISSPGAALFGARWQPGPGRGAGRIVC